MGKYYTNGEPVNGVYASHIEREYHMYDKKTGDYIRSFNKLYEIVWFLNIKWNSRYLIEKACMGQQKSSHGYLWSYYKWDNYYKAKERDEL